MELAWDFGTCLGFWDLYSKQNVIFAAISIQIALCCAGVNSNIYASSSQAAGF
jgi:hypothetical protein